jgi:hypothetical protein
MQHEVVMAFLGKKYKPVADKVKPILGVLPGKFRIERNISGDPLKDMPVLNPWPPDSNLQEDIRKSVWKQWTRSIILAFSQTRN